MRTEPRNQGILRVQLKILRNAVAHNYDKLMKKAFGDSNPGIYRRKKISRE